MVGLNKVRTSTDVENRIPKDSNRLRWGSAFLCRYTHGLLASIKPKVAGRPVGVKCLISK